jgi:SAM-dependent methyltransferase
LFYYFFRSLLLRGPLKHFQLLFGEWYYERKFGIRTNGFKTSDSEKHHHYQAAAYTALMSIFNALAIDTKHYAFYDIGCGRGRVLFMATQYGYNRLYGIELDGALLKEAEANLQAIRSQSKTLTIQLEQKNVLEYSFENQEAIYFLFNPFNSEVMAGFIENVLSTNKQACYFVYMNPVYSHVFKQKNIPVHGVIKSWLYTEAIVYRLPARTS